MSDFLNKAKDAAEGLKDKAEEALAKVEDKLPEGVKDKVDAAKEKVEGLLHKGDDAPAAE
jgi:ElaB/YqjD/DUF883 family membrane-anchored ribosome-binding protein